MVSVVHDILLSKQLSYRLCLAASVRCGVNGVKHCDSVTVGVSTNSLSLSLNYLLPGYTSVR